MKEHILTGLRAVFAIAIICTTVYAFVAGILAYMEHAGVPDKLDMKAIKQEAKYRAQRGLK